MIDIHTHISQMQKPIPDEFRDAARAYQLNTGVEVTHYGTEGDLLKGMVENGVEKACLLPLAGPDIEGVVKLNNFMRTAMLENSCFEGFGSVNPNFKGAEEEADRALRQEGLKGLVVDPVQDFDFVGSDFWRVLEVAKASDAVIFVHGEYLEKDDYFRAEDINETLLGFPQLSFVFSLSKSKGHILAEPNVYMDTAHAAKEELEGALKRFGVRQLLFGSDFKYNFYPSYEITKIQELDLSQEEKEMILGGNAAELLGLPFYKKASFLDKVSFLKRFRS